MIKIIKNWFVDDINRVNRDAICYRKEITHIQVYPWEKFVDYQGKPIRSEDMKKIKDKWFLNYKDFERNDLRIFDWNKISSNIYKDCFKRYNLKSMIQHLLRIEKKYKNFKRENQ